MAHASVLMIVLPSVLISFMTDISDMIIKQNVTGQ